MAPPGRYVFTVLEEPIVQDLWTIFNVKPFRKHSALDTVVLDLCPLMGGLSLYAGKDSDPDCPYHLFLGEVDSLLLYSESSRRGTDSLCHH
jgi:hypothetical protein